MYLAGTFPKLTEAERQRLVDAGEIISYKTGSVVIREGDVVTSLMLIKSGNLRVTRNYLDNLSAEFAGPLGPGEVVGEMSFIDGSGASANLIADGETEMLSISRPALTAMLESNDGFAGRFFESLFLDLARKLRSTNLRVLPVPP